MFYAVTTKPLDFFPGVEIREGGIVPAYTHCAGDGQSFPAGIAIAAIIENPVGRFLCRQRNREAFCILDRDEFKQA